MKLIGCESTSGFQHQLFVLFDYGTWKFELFFKSPERGAVCSPEISIPPGYFPVPLSATVCVPAPSLMDRVALRAPVAVGLNVTVMVQSQPALRLVPHLLVSLKSPGSVPPIVMLVMASAVL